MAEEITVPKVGKVKKKYVALAGAGIAGYVGYAWWKRGSSAPADLPAYTEADVQADGVTDTAGGRAGSAANAGGGNTDSSTTPDSDQEWAAQAAEILGGAIDQQQVYAALGAYLTHQPLTAAQESIVRSAVGRLGYPPGGAYPILTGTGAEPSALGQVSGLTVVKHSATTVDLQWARVTGAPGYRVYRVGLGEEPVGDSGDTKWQGRGLQPNTSYQFQVAARSSTGAPGPKSAVVSVKTDPVKLTAPKSVKVSAVTRTTAHATCGTVAGATSYRWYVNGTAHGASDHPAYTVGGLKSNSSYTLTVAADTTNQTPGPKSGGVRFKTKK
ncbi:fibronectin type III domain-containing protein [Streptomyces sp. NPDC056653]|uniref:fibronectin type III domain-containing protein n=1 Tax=Streptomyces sp. NPDC056653 TaxID=3345894 RepID=UPI0036858F12